MTSFTTQALSTLVLSTALIGGAFAQASARVDTSVDGIYTALTNSKNLQGTVDTLVANGATFASVVSVAGAAGISMDAVKELNLCTSNLTASMSATCMKPSSMRTAYAAGQNDPLSFLPATAAGKAKPAGVKEASQ